MSPSTVAVLDEFEAVNMRAARSLRDAGFTTEADAIERRVGDVLAASYGLAPDDPERDRSTTPRIDLDAFEARMDTAAQRCRDAGSADAVAEIEAATDVVLACAYGLLPSSGTDPDRFEA